MIRSVILCASIFPLIACSAIAENETVSPANTAAEPSAQAAETSTTSAQWQPEDGDVITYKVLRKGKKFGSHSVSFSKDGDELTAVTSVELEAGLGPIKLFTYTLDATETWRDGKLVKLSGQVNDDGNAGSVQAELSGDELSISGTEYTGTAPADTLPASHWNVAQTQADTLLSTEDGELLDVSVTKQGTETVMVGGAPVEATRYLMDSDIDVDLWYDDQGRWVKLAFEARGQDIEYVLTEMY